MTEEDPKLSRRLFGQSLVASTATGAMLRVLASDDPNSSVESTALNAQNISNLKTAQHVLEGAGTGAIVAAAGNAAAGTASRRDFMITGVVGAAGLSLGDAAGRAAEDMEKPHRAERNRRREELQAKFLNKPDSPRER